MGKKKVVKDAPLSDSDLDEIDHFQKERDMMMLSEVEESTDDEFYNEGILDLPSEEEEEERWGRKKQNYYEADDESGDEEEEAKEAVRLQRKKLSTLSAEDFNARKGSKRESSKRESVKEEEVDAVYFSSSSEGEDQPEESGVDLEGLMTEFKEKLSYLHEYLDPLMHEPSQLPELRHGLTFLRIKHRLLSAYCACIAFYIAAKAEGRSLEAKHPLFDRLVEYRLLLERMRPLEARMQPQIDRLLHAAHVAEKEVGSNVEMIEEEDEEQLKPNLSNLKIEKTEGDTYRPPRIAAVSYPHEKQSKHKSRMLTELEEEEGEEPEEEAFNSVIKKGDAKEDRARKARELYEEDQLVRLPETRKDKKKKDKYVDELEDLEELMEGMGKRKYEREAGSDAEESMGSVSSMSEIEDDDEPVRKKPRARRQGTTSFRPIEDMDGDSRRRPVPRDILRNRGQTPHRPKEQRNPRVRMRMKHERKSKKLGSFKPISRQPTGRYTGESSGIRSNLSKSVRFK